MSNKHQTIMEEVGVAQVMVLANTLILQNIVLCGTNLKGCVQRLSF